MCEITDHRNKFTQQEDERLVSLIKENGAKRWKSIAKKMQGKTARQCRDRYMNYLREGLGNSPWTEDEDYLLSEKVKEIGTHWSKIAIFFKGRSTNNIKNRWYTFHLKKKMRPKNNIQHNTNNIPLNNFTNFSNQSAFQQQQINHGQPQIMLNYPMIISGPAIYSSSPPPCSLIITDLYKNDPGYYFPTNDSLNNLNLNLNIASSPNNIELNNVNSVPFGIQNNLNNSEKNNSNVNTIIMDDFKEDTNKNSFSGSDIFDSPNENKRIKRIPSIFELLNPISDSYNM